MRRWKSDQTPSSEVVRAAVAASLENGASLVRIAAQLGTSARSLQRHLAMTGASFSAIVEDVRMAEACRLLDENSEEIVRIASLLGYSGPTSFTRAFQRAMNVPPARYRRLHRGGEASKDTEKT